jgi:phage shock protein C
LEQKRLYKGHAKMLSGVCSGVAEYFNIDPTLVRLASVILAFVTAFVPALIAYFVCAVIIPDPPA